MPNFLPVSSTSPDQRLAVAEGLARALVHLSSIMVRVASEKAGAFDTMEGLRASLGDVIGLLQAVRADIRAIVDDETSVVARQLDEIARGVRAAR